MTDSNKTGEECQPNITWYKPCGLENSAWWLIVEALEQAGHEIICSGIINRCDLEGDIVFERDGRTYGVYIHRM